MTSFRVSGVFSLTAYCTIHGFVVVFFCEIPISVVIQTLMRSLFIGMLFC